MPPRRQTSHRAGAATDSHGLMDHPNKRLAADGQQHVTLAVCRPVRPLSHLGASVQWWEDEPAKGPRFLGPAYAAK